MKKIVTEQKRYVSPILEVLVFWKTDCIRMSGDSGGEGDDPSQNENGEQWTPWQPIS